MSLTILTWNVRGIMSSPLFLSNLLLVTGCDIAIICENKSKLSSVSYINSIDTIYHSVSKTDRFNDFLNCTHGKGGIYMMYIFSLQFMVKEMVYTNSDRIVCIELKSQNYRSILNFIFGVYLPVDG